MKHPKIFGGSVKFTFVLMNISSDQLLAQSSNYMLIFLHTFQFYISGA